MKVRALCTVALAFGIGLVGCGPGDVVSDNDTTETDYSNFKIETPVSFEGEFNPEQLKVGLRVGNLAPEILGPDLDGADFKLSDYRGKVVMLSFWSET